MMVSALHVSEFKVTHFDFEGPAHGRPMQLGSVSGGSRNIEQEQGRLAGLDNRDDSNTYPTLQRS